MKIRILLLVFLLGLLKAAFGSGLEVYWNFNSVLKDNRYLIDGTDRDYTARVRNTGERKEHPVASEDVPPQIAKWAKASLDMHKGMIHFPLGAKADIEDFTLNLWLKPEATKASSSALAMRVGGWLVANNAQGNQLQFRSFADNQILGFGDALVPDRWQMLTVRRQGQQITVFVDGESRGTQTLKGALAEGRVFYFGTSDTSGRYAYAGLLTDISLYSIPLDAAAVEALYAGTEPRLVHRGPIRTRELTTPFKKTDLVYTPKRSVDLLKDGELQARIVRPEAGDFSAIAEAVQQRIARSWGVTIPIVDFTEVDKQGGALILVGSKNGSPLLRELTGNRYISGNKEGYEARTIPEALDWGRDVLYFGGNNAEAVLRGVDAFLARTPSLQNVAHFIDVENIDRSALPDAEKMVAAALVFEGPTNQTVVSQFMIPAADLYTRTGDDAYVKTFAEVQKIFAQIDKNPIPEGNVLGAVPRPPSFVFHEFVQSVWAVEQSPAFTEEDRQISAEIMRTMAELMMDRWEMDLPTKLYEQGKQAYLTNHPTFASRSIATLSRYLLSRYDFTPAIYWKTVAENALDSVSAHPHSPEDAGGYQYLVYSIFIDYAISSGRYQLDFFTSENYRRYIDDTKASINHRGFMPGTGDANPQYMMNAHRILQQAVTILGDQEAAYILKIIAEHTQWESMREFIADLDLSDAIPAPSKHTLGLTLVKMVPFKQRYYLVRGLLKLPPLDKASFRSGWGANDEFLALNGVNDGEHGHIEANAITQYLRGDRLWLFDGDYIRKYADNANTIIVNKDGRAPDQRFLIMRRNARTDRVSQIVGSAQTEDRRIAALSLLVQNIQGIDWTRSIGYEALDGFWVIDHLQARYAGDYRVQAVWRVTGTMEPSGQALLFTQKPADNPQIPWHLSLTEGSGAARTLQVRFERGHGRKDGHLLDMEGVFPDKNTKYVLQRKGAQLEKGESLAFVNFIKALPGDEVSAVQVRQLADNAYVAQDGAATRFAAFGKYAAGDITVDADAVFISNAGITAIGLRELQLGKAVFRSEQEGGESIAFAADTLFNGLEKAELAQWLAAVATQGKVVPAAAAEQLAVAEGKIAAVAKLEGKVSALVGAAEGFAVGTGAGEVVLLDTRGNVVGDRQFKSEVSALTVLHEEGKARWAAGFFPESLAPGNAPVRMLDGKGELLWEGVIPAFNRRNGTPQTMFPAVLEKNGAQSLIVGGEANHYHAFDLSGKEIWKSRITHGATAGAAGDMTGDGRDDIAAGGEYYTHVLLDADGEQLVRVTASPWNECVTVADVNGDGLKEAFFGRSDSWVYCFTPKANPIRNWQVNVGGRPVAITSLEDGQTARRLAVATAMGEVVLIDKDGRVIDRTHLPAPLADLIEFGNELYAACLDGFVYQLDAEGKVLRKYPYAYDWQSTTAPRLAASAEGVAVGSGSNLYILARDR